MNPRFRPERLLESGTKSISMGFAFVAGTWRRKITSCLVFLVILFVARELNRPLVVIGIFGVPTALAEKGYSGDYVRKQTVYAVSSMEQVSEWQDDQLSLIG